MQSHQHNSSFFDVAVSAGYAGSCLAQARLCASGSEDGNVRLREIH